VVGFYLASEPANAPVATLMPRDGKEWSDAPLV